MEFGRLLLALGALALLGGCNTPLYHSEVAEHWGEAQRANVAHMIVDPDGAEEQPEGLDPATAVGSTVKYRQGQAEQATGSGAPSIINIGTSGR
jgi:hypothetical protein